MGLDEGLGKEEEKVRVEGNGKGKGKGREKGRGRGKDTYGIMLESRERSCREKPGNGVGGSW